jgi:hypothetical protein
MKCRAMSSDDIGCGVVTAGVGGREVGIVNAGVVSMGSGVVAVTGAGVWVGEGSGCDGEGAVQPAEMTKTMTRAARKQKNIRGFITLSFPRSNISLTGFLPGFFTAG